MRIVLTIKRILKLLRCRRGVLVHITLLGVALLPAAAMAAVQNHHRNHCSNSNNNVASSGCYSSSSSSSSSPPPPLLSSFSRNFHCSSPSLRGRRRRIAATSLTSGCCFCCWQKPPLLGRGRGGRQQRQQQRRNLPLPATRTTTISKPTRKCIATALKSQPNDQQRASPPYSPPFPSSSSFPSSPSSYGAILVDVENVRGKSGFSMGHDEVVDLMSAWSQAHRLGGRLALFCDHGSDSSSFLLPDRGDMAVAFSGSGLAKADDVIAAAVPHFVAAVPSSASTDAAAGGDGGGSVCVVTADRELTRRCRKSLSANRRRRLHVVQPIRLLEDLAALMSASSSASPASPSPGVGSSKGGGTASADDVGDSWKVQLAVQLLETQALLQTAKSRKRKKALKHKTSQLRAKLSREEGLLERVASILASDASPTSFSYDPRGEDDLNESDQGAGSSDMDPIDAVLWHRYGQIRKTRRRPQKETTKDRSALAEELRLRLLDRYGEFGDNQQRTAVGDNTGNDAYRSDTASGDDGCASERAMPVLLSPALSYLQWRTRPAKTAKEVLLLQQQQQQQQQEGQQGGNGYATTQQFGDNTRLLRPPLRLVVISDTHGFHEQLGETLPDGDLLLHLGDFSPTPNDKEALSDFDKWLSRQPHRQKIVLRGNHEKSRKVDFSRSGALYVTRPTTLNIAGYDFAFLPFQGRGLSMRSLPRNACDVLVSHYPPERYLDRHHKTNQHLGSQVLRRGLEGPKVLRDVSLLLCGHVHEGRGAMRIATMGNNPNRPRETLLINAANADAGRATCLEHKPVIVQLEPGERRRETVRTRVVEMDGRHEYLNHKDKAFFMDSCDVVGGGVINGEPSSRQHQHQQLLLAVDLGLRTGVSLFSRNPGKLLRYEDFHIASPEEVEAFARQLLPTWEADTGGRVTHVVVEGSENSSLQEIWRRVAAAENVSVEGRRFFLTVAPSDWRTDLLSPHQRASGEASKAASRLLAKRIVQELGDGEIASSTDDEEIQTDAAESIMLGFHVLRRLGWVPCSNEDMLDTPVSIPVTVGC